METFKDSVKGQTACLCGRLRTVDLQLRHRLMGQLKGRRDAPSREGNALGESCTRFWSLSMSSTKYFDRDSRTRGTPSRRRCQMVSYDLAAVLTFQHIDRKPLSHGLSVLLFLTEALRAERLKLWANVASHRRLKNVSSKQRLKRYPPHTVTRTVNAYRTLGLIQRPYVLHVYPTEYM